MPQCGTELEVPQPDTMATDESSTAATVVESSEVGRGRTLPDAGLERRNGDRTRSVFPAMLSRNNRLPEIEVTSPVVAEPILAEAIEQSASISDSPFPEFSADDLASAIGLPTMPAKPADPNLPSPLPEGVSSQFPTDYAVSPDKLPAWSYEHERPASRYDHRPAHAKHAARYGRVFRRASIAEPAGIAVPRR